jgi:hypothetical protein
VLRAGAVDLLQRFQDIAHAGPGDGPAAIPPRHPGLGHGTDVGELRTRVGPLERLAPGPEPRFVQGEQQHGAVCGAHRAVTGLAA